MSSKNKQVQKKEMQSDVELAQDRPVFTPPTDIYEKDDGVLVVCDVPGVDEKHVDVSLENDVLTITATQESVEPEGHQAAYRGYESGVFRRSFALTTEVDHDKISAKVANGVLRIHLPKAERARPRRIAVEAGS